MNGVAWTNLARGVFNAVKKCWNRSVMGITLAIGCRSPFGKALACEAKANLHSLAFFPTRVRFLDDQRRSSVAGGSDGYWQSQKPSSRFADDL
jgi:hypothetical protein